MGIFNPTTLKFYRTEAKFYGLFCLASKREPGGAASHREGGRRSARIQPTSARARWATAAAAFPACGATAAAASVPVQRMPLATTRAAPESRRMLKRSSTARFHGYQKRRVTNRYPGTGSTNRSLNRKSANTSYPMVTNRALRK